MPKSVEITTFLGIYILDHGDYMDNVDHQIKG